jgi:7-carboxy-7-deazaguanine synthase
MQPVIAAMPTPSIVWTPQQLQRLKILADHGPGTLVVHEIYASIQGESSYAGLPCTFVRLTGCPLRCRWCDTPHAFTEGSPMPVAQIVQRVEELALPLVEVTGGEPLAQPECLRLLAALADTGRTVLLETSGAIPIDQVDPRVTIIMDLKCPDSGEEGSNRYENLKALKPTDELKFVVANRSDFDWAVRAIRALRLERWPILVSPVFGEVAYEELARWILASNLPLRFQLQLHKHIWDPSARGV